MNKKPCQNNHSVCPLIWPRAIILMDMNAFFASIEQLDFPELRARPIAVTNGIQGTGIITCSYEARRYGIKTGMRLQQAKNACPELIQCPARPARYATISKKIMQALNNITPDIEIFSVDEAFLDVTRCQQAFGNPAYLAKKTQEIVYDVAKLPCSVGVSGDKTTAKFAAKQKKPMGLTVIPPWQAGACLAPMPVDAICGIGKGIKRFLAGFDVHTCGDVASLPVSILGKRFGPIGRRLWLMCQGLDPEPIKQSIAPAKSMGHGKVMPPNTKDKAVVLTYLQHMSEKLSARLRSNALTAKKFSVGLKSRDLGWIGDKFQLAIASQHGSDIYQAAKKTLLENWDEEPIFQIHLHAHDPLPAHQQGDLFMQCDHKLDCSDAVMDQINQRFGEFTLAPARLLQRSRMPNVIAPAWKPEGHRQTIPLE